MAALRSGGKSSQLSNVIASVLDSHPKTKKEASTDRKRKIDIIKNAVHEHFVEGSGGGTHVDSGRKLMVAGSESSIANESTMVNQFAMTNLSKADPFFEFASDSVRVRGVEYLGSIVAPSYPGDGRGTTIWTAQFNPLTWTGTRLARYASMFNYFRFEEVEVIYEPIVSKMTSGSLVAAILPNVARQIPKSGVEGLRATMELRNALMFPVYQVQTMTYRFSTPTAPLLCVKPTSAFGPQEATLSNQGTLFFKDASGLTSGTTYGQVVLKYKICFYDSCIGADPSSESPDYAGNIEISGSTTAGLEGLLQCTSTGLFTAKSYDRFGYFFPKVNVGFTDPWTAWNVKWFKLPANSTGATMTFYPSLIDALAGTGNAIFDSGMIGVGTGPFPVEMTIFAGSDYISTLLASGGLVDKVSASTRSIQDAQLRASVKAKVSQLDRDPSWISITKEQTKSRLPREGTD